LLVVAVVEESIPSVDGVEEEMEKEHRMVDRYM
jgi:hypothetical protein